jgi:cephalosporin-C deacetylase-like acetyl esterase
MRRDRVSGDLFGLAVAATFDRPPIPRRTQEVHSHSHVAHAQELPRLATRAAAILAWLREHGPATDKEVMRGLGFVDVNTVQPRITEMVDAKVLVEVGERVDPVTHKTVRVTALALGL